MKIYQNIKKRRMELKMSQEELAKKIGYADRSMIAKIESGKVDITESKVVKFANALQTTPKKLMGWDEPPAKNIIMPDAYSIPILDRISCGSGSSINHEYAGEFVLDRSIKADYCLIASGDSMIDAGIEDGDRVFMRKVTEYKDGKIYGVVLRSEDTATLKRVYFQEDKVLLQPCNPSYKPVCLSESEVYIVGECIGIFKTI